MKENCKNYESRQYPSGDTVRMCRLDLAPNAPWECPDGCASFELRMASGGWTVGSLAPNALSDAPSSVSEGTAAEVLDAAENIINAVGPEIRDEVHKERGVTSLSENEENMKKWWQFWR